MKYDVRKNWIATLGLIKSSPVVLLPFVVIAFLEALALEGICFATRFPISVVASPVIKKFFGEAFIHYPGNLIALPRIFFYVQIVIYVLFSVFLTAISVNIFANIRSSLPLKTKALVKNALSKYFPFAVFGVIMMTLTVLLQKVDLFFFAKAMRFSSKALPKIFIDLSPLWASLVVLVSTIALFTLTLMTVPIMVLEKKSLLSALLKAVILGLRRFFTVFSLIALPFLVYLPLVFLKGSAAAIAEKTFPEMTVLITAAGILMAVFIDSFVILALSRFVADEGTK